MITINELFSGIGSQVAALRRLDIPYNVVGISEIDRFAIQSYEAINGPTRNYGDISKVELLDYADLWTYSFPCQDLSVAGKQLGITENTRSGLLFQVERLLETSVLFGNQPKFLLLENVKALVSKKFKPDFDRWLSKLEELGYNNYWQVLNAKDYGVPQNRERVFVVSIHKDVDNKGYKFPHPVPLKKRLKDVLEETVDEKFYLSDKVIKGFIEKNKRDAEKGNGFKFEPQEPDAPYAKTITAGYDKIRSCSTYIKQVGNIVETDSFGGNPQTGRVYDADGISPTLNTMQGGNREPKIIEPFIAAMRGRNPDNPSDRTAGAPTEQRLEPNGQGICNTITTVQKDNLVVEPQVLTPKRTEYGKKMRKAYEAGILKESRHNMNVLEPRKDGISNTLTTVQKDNLVVEPKNACTDGPATGVLEIGIGHNPVSKKFEFDGFHDDKECPTLLATDYKCPKCYSDGIRIRKLTPRECWRLMGFTDLEFDLAQMSGVSNSQLYKQAGNSIVVDVLVGIFKEIFE